MPAGQFRVLRAATNGHLCVLSVYGCCAAMCAVRVCVHVSGGLVLECICSVHARMHVSVRPSVRLSVRVMDPSGPEP